MPMIDQLLWVIFPYVCIVVFVLGHIFRYRYDQFGWTAKSCEFFEKKRLNVGSLMFHLGIIPVFLEHVLGLGIPKTWTRAIDISDKLYHFESVYGDGIFESMSLMGVFILSTCRFSNRTVRMYSSKSYMIVNTLLLFIVFMGVYSSLVTNHVVEGFDYRDNLSIWFRSLFTLSPSPEIMSVVPIAFKMHVLTGFLIFAIWPFTRLVHVWSVPLNYVGRSYILYRKDAPRNKHVG